VCRRLGLGVSGATGVSDGATPRAAWRPDGDGGRLFPDAGWQQAGRDAGSATLAKVFGALVAAGAALALLAVLYAKRAAVCDAIPLARRCRHTSLCIPC
jgi:hypothetical protein